MAIYTENYSLEKPDQTDVYNIEVFNNNADAVDAVLHGKVDSDGGDISSTNIATLEELTEEFPVPAAGETSKTFFGKVRKSIQDFNNFKTGILTVGMLVNNAVTDNSGLPVSAAVAKALQDQLTQLNSDYVSRTTDNIVGAQVKLTRNAGVNADSYNQAPVWIRADYQANNGYRAQIGLENGGVNAITLWLDIDGRLKATNNNDVTTTFATTDELALKASVYQLSLPQVTLTETNEIQLGDSIQVPAGQYLVVLDAIARSTDNTATDLHVKADDWVFAQGRIPYTNGTHQNLCINNIVTLSSEANITFTVTRGATNGEVVFFGGTLSLIRGATNGEVVFFGGTLSLIRLQ
ncbi:hypothetical protein QE152_g39984 [Popillia japonica]|uniref:Tail fiber protein n=1 Tax=Popillia japonica TaxID=7064 RepID=A0AAW1HSP2_POPJA